jgi:cyclase
VTSAALPQDTRATTEVADGVVAVLNGAGQLGRANSTILLHDADAVVVDTMLTDWMAESITAALSRLGATARLVINTHNHLDHLGGNRIFPDAEIMAHPVTARIVSMMAAEPQFLPGLLTHFGVDPSAFDLVGPSTTDLAHPALPEGTCVRAFRGAHSPADLAVWLPGPGVMVAGDLCSNGVTPLARHGSLSGWVRALDELIALAPATVIPGHGPVTGVRTLETVRDYLRAVLEAATALASERPEMVVPITGTLQGHPDAGSVELVAEAVKTVAPTPVAEWAEPERTAINLAVAVAEVTGTPLSLKPVGQAPAQASRTGQTEPSHRQEGSDVR